MTSTRFAMVRSARGALSRIAPPWLYGAVRGAWRRARLAIPASWQSSTYPGIPGPVHDEDYMLRDQTDEARLHYIRTGTEPVERIGAGLEAMGRSWADVRAVLDFGAGYARVLRFLKARNPHVALTAADVNRQAVAFCAGAFGARPWPVSFDVREVASRGPFDVIWVGSVLTHLPLGDDAILLDRLAQNLAPGGLLVFTTLGELIPSRLGEYGQAARRRVDEIAASLAREQTFFVEAAPDAHAMTFHGRESVRRMIAGAEPALRLVRHDARGWDDHQDVWCCARVG
jgi:SAM-dependent methyltransferase